MVNLEIELNKLKEVVKDHPIILSKSLEKGVEIPILLALWEQNLKRATYRLLSYVFRSEKGIFRKREDGSIKVYTPSQLFIRLKGHPLKKRKRDLKELEFKEFNIDAKNFVVKAYQIIYDAYLKEYVEEDRKKRAPMSKLLSLRR